MVVIKMTLKLEDYEKYLKLINSKKDIPKKIGRPRKTKYIIPDFLKDMSDYPCHYHCGICNSNLYLRHPSNYIQHTKTKKHLKNISFNNG